MLFYEPCHEGVGRAPSKARTRDRGRDRNLRHPGLDGGYFGAYEQVDPQSQRSLASHFAPDISLRNVYAKASAAAVDYLGALSRFAQASGQTAFLGFCRSGTQATHAQTLLGGRGLHLWRAPREQFASYDWPNNDYFMAGTLLQLAHSRRYGALARALAPRALQAPLLRLALHLPDRHARSQYRLARRVVRALSPEQSYGLFVLSWLVSHIAGQTAAEHSFSLSELARDEALRATIETAYDIDFSALRETPGTIVEGIDYDRIEQSVSAQLSVLTGRPVRFPV
jgi:hypothetical protein